MSAACRAWVVAVNTGAAEAIKDQGICRCNGVLRSVHQHAKNNIRSQAKKLISDSSSSAISMTMQRPQEEKLRKVMELSCWGPNTLRF